MINFSRDFLIIQSAILTKSYSDYNPKFIIQSILLLQSSMSIGFLMQSIQLGTNKYRIHHFRFLTQEPSGTLISLMVLHHGQTDDQERKWCVFFISIHCSFSFRDTFGYVSVLQAKIVAIFICGIQIMSRNHTGRWPALCSSTRTAKHH